MSLTYPPRASLRCADTAAAGSAWNGWKIAPCGRGHARALLGRVAEAVADGEAALRLEPQGKQDLLVACLDARAARRLLLTPPKGSRGRRPEVACEERAAELLCKALLRVEVAERAAYWRKHIQSEPALAAILRHPKVMRLIAGLGSN